MKRCEYCRMLVEDETERCPSCGATAFLKHCGNCGNEYESGAFCPACGVRAGQEPRLCPRCRTEYYTNACPNCGYLPAERESAPAEAEPAPKKRGSLVWWILGWIFLFPLPLSLLIARSKKLKPWMKAVLIVAVWGFFLFAMENAQTDTPETPDLPAATETAALSDPADAPETGALAPGDRDGEEIDANLLFSASRPLL